MTLERIMDNLLRTTSNFDINMQNLIKVSTEFIQQTDLQLPANSMSIKSLEQHIG